MKDTELRKIIATNNKVLEAVENMSCSIIRLNPLKINTLAEARAINGLLTTLQDAGVITINKST